MPSLIGRCGGGGGGGLVPLFGVYTSTTVSVASGGSATLDWVYSTGDHVLDLTDPFNPSPATQGVYYVQAHFLGAVGMTAGRSISGEVDAVNSVFPIDGVSDVYPNAFGNTGSLIADTLSPMKTTDYFQLITSNGDTIAHNLGAGPINVVRIGTY